VQDGTVMLADGFTCAARHVILALPPRLLAALQFTPALPTDALRDLAAIPTWMAGHAKLVAVYDTPFWRDAGLSGDAISHRGPLMEIHDASGPQGTPAALFGFLGGTAPQRNGRGGEMIEAARHQLARLFGAEAMHPREITLRDWATEPETATAADHIALRHHPTYGLPDSLAAAGLDRLHIAGTESEVEAGGLMEGALAAAERITRSILGRRSF
jgi:monoamine oxidase